MWTTKRQVTAGSAARLMLVGAALSTLLIACGTAPAASPPAPSAVAPPAAATVTVAPPATDGSVGPAPTIAVAPAQQSGDVPPTPEVLPPYSGPTSSVDEIATREAQLQLVNPPEPPFPDEGGTPGAVQGPVPGSDTGAPPATPTP